MKWYYTKQKLPEKEGLYLCYTEDGFYVLCKFSNNLYNIDGFDLCDGDKRGFYRGNSTVGFRRYNAIEYWTCLPEPPVPRDEKGIQKLNSDSAKQALIDCGIMNEDGTIKDAYLSYFEQASISNMYKKEGITKREPLNLNKEKEYCGEYFDEDWCR